MDHITKSMNDTETEWMDDIETGQFTSDTEARKRLAGKLLVDQSLKKSYPLSLRVPDADLEAIQLKAAKAGIPYQTLIKSVLHQFTTDQL